MNSLFSAIILFTRLPLWRWVDIPRESYDRAVVYWPLVGWLTGGLCALIIVLCPPCWDISIVVTVALLARVLLTGALHEDGLADFCDGFGGGHDKDRILAIMKDSHIGTYGVIGLILYYLLAVRALSAMPAWVAGLAILACDPFAKLCASQLTNILSYARPEGAKNRISYTRMNAAQIALQLVTGSAPLFYLIYKTGPLFGLAAIAPIAICASLMLLMRKRIGGYTGDCCGATFLICELSMLLAVDIIWWSAS